MQINLSQGSPAGLPALPAVHPPKTEGNNTVPPKADPLKTAQDQNQIKSQAGLAMPSLDLDLPQYSPQEGARLTEIELGGGYLNDSNFFVKQEDDLGMTTSYRAQANLGFTHASGSETHVNLDHRSALHSQFLSQANDITEQSLITTQDYTLGVSNNAFLNKDPRLSAGVSLNFKGMDTNPHSGWANTQASLHEQANLRQYHNQENPFVQNESYLTPMLTAAFENESITGKRYLKTEAQVGMGPMIPLQQNRDFYSPLMAKASGSIKFGYAYRELPIVFLKVEGGVSNEPLPYQRDHGTLGAVGFSIGNEFKLRRGEKADLSLFLESKVIQPFGNMTHNPLPDQSGKHDLIHEMVNVKLKLTLK